MSKISKIALLQIGIQLALLTCSAVAISATHTQDDKPLIEVAEWLKIQPSDQTPLFNTLGRVNAIRQCGGQGRLIGWRNEACVAGYQEPYICPYPSEGLYRGEIEFSPKEDAEELGVRLVVQGGDTVKDLSALLANSTVRGGRKYTMQGAGTPIPELKGHIMTTQFSLFRVKDRKMELCAEADFIVY